MSANLRHRLRPVAGVVVVMAAVALLHRLGAGLLAAPPLLPGSELVAWLDTRDPVTVGFALFRLGALALAYHLAITTAVAAVGRALHRPGVVRAATAWTLPPFRGAVQRMVGLGLSAAAVVTTPVPAAVAAPSTALATGTATLRAVDPAVVVLSPAGDGDGPATLRLVLPRVTDGTATMRAVPSPPERLERPTGSSRVGPAPDQGQPEVDAGDPAASGSHVVRPGDHLWRIAEDRLTPLLGRTPTDDEIAPYWRRLVAANPQLVDADLLFPGDVVSVPAP